MLRLRREAGGDHKGGFVNVIHQGGISSEQITGE